MDPLITRFLSDRTEARADCRTSLISLHREFMGSLPDDRHRSLWPRWRFKAEIEQLFLTGLDEHGVVHIAGLYLTTPRRWARDDGGRLRLVAA